MYFYPNNNPKNYLEGKIPKIFQFEKLTFVKNIALILMRNYGQNLIFWKICPAEKCSKSTGISGFTAERERGIGFGTSVCKERYQPG